MPKKVIELSALEVRHLLGKPGRHAVGGVAGLYLDVADTGSACWTLRVSIGKKRPELGCGGFPDVTLAAARDRAREMRNELWKGIDPRQAKREAKARLLQAQAQVKKFREVAIECHAAREAEFSNKKHAAQWINTLKTYAFPAIGDKSCGDITVDHLLEVLKPIWSTKTETATRVRQRVESVLDYAKVMKYRPEAPNPASWEGNLEVLLPKASRVSTVKHHPSLSFQRLMKFLADLRARAGMAAKCLEFGILTTTRSGEVRGARWREINLETATWEIPASRMKGRKIHRIPLCESALRLLRALGPGEPNAFVFPNDKGKKLSDGTLNAVIRRMKLDVKVVYHGFRSTFKEWARALNKYLDEVSELQLAHVNSDETRSAYARDELLPLRRLMMAEYGQFCEGAAANETTVSGDIAQTLPVAA